MYKFLIFFCLLTNFWGVYILISLGWYNDASYIIPPNKYYIESLWVLFLISFILLYIGFTKYHVKRQHIILEVNLKNKRVIYALYLFFFLLSLSTVNFSLDNSMRGVGQMDMEGRAGMSGFLTSFSLLVIPFILFLLLTKPFKRNNILVSALCIVALMSNVTTGGRKIVAYMVFLFLLYSYYYSKLKFKNILIYSLPLVVLFPIALVMRDIDNFSFAEANGPVVLLATSILAVNSDPSFLWAVKSYIEQGYSLSPFVFLGHFISIFIPSFLFPLLFGSISYTRSVFYFDSLFNTNENQGYDFMLLADFYWCFGVIGYLLFIVFIIWCLYYFKKNIYSMKLHRIITAFMVVLFVCQQRNDFGPILKPIVYSYVFIYIIERVCVKKVTKKIL